MKKETFFLKQMSVLAFALFSAISCSNDREFLGATENVALKKCMSPSNTRTIEEAKTIAADFLAHSMKIDSSKPNPMRAQAQPTVQVLTKDSLTGKIGDKVPYDVLPDTLLYGVTYSSSTIMVPADGDAPTVVAMLDTPSESITALITRNNGDNPMYELLRPIFYPEMYHRLTQEDYLKTIMPEKIEDYYPVWGPDEEKEEEKRRRERERYIAPKIRVEWEQGEPFNLFCPRRCPAGCVAIAASQAMTLTGVPFAIPGRDFTDIASFKNKSYSKNHPDLMENVAYLVKFVGLQVETDYDANGSEASPLKAVDLFLHMGMTMSMNKDDIKKTLRDYQRGFVMVVSGYGKKRHCYLIDGYNYIPNGLKQNVYMHVNFGWGPEFNGFFLQNLCSFNQKQFGEIAGKWTFYSIY